jgi:hypothetical protein
MKSWTWMAVMGLCLAGWQAMAQELEERKEAPPGLSLRLTDEVISKAVRETLAEEGRTSIKRESGRVLSADTAYRKFERGFSEAEKPGCFGPNALKFQPSTTVANVGGQGYVVGFTGLLALPFWAAAVVRGKCK